MSVLDKNIFSSDEAAYAYLESIVWANGPVCPHCGGMERIGVLKGGRPGLRKCYHCRKQFTVTVKTVFESSHIPLHKWLQAAFLLCSSKKGISSHQMHRILQVTYKTAWFMTHRLREAMRAGELPPMGGNGGAVEADETYFSKKVRGAERKNKRGPHHLKTVVALVERDGDVRSFTVDKANVETVGAIVRKNVAKEARLMTDGANYYKTVGKEYAEHNTVEHATGEYVRGEAHTNTIEGVFSIFKRGMKGIYQHCGEQHLHRYLAEFDFRYNNRKCDDLSRSKLALVGISGKRLTYKGPDAP
jgi:transposase-like protein